MRTKAGDVYDTYARLFAEHLPKYIPAIPISSSKTCPARIDTPPTISIPLVTDGLTIGPVFPASISIKSSAERRFNMIGPSLSGSAAPSLRIICSYMRADTPYKTIDDVMKTSSRQNAAPAAPVQRLLCAEAIG